MAVREFNCNKIKRTFWPFVMKDKKEDGKVVEKGKRLLVRMPQKGVFEAIKNLEMGDGEENSENEADAIYDLLAAVLNNNMGRVRVTAAELADYDIEECTAILDAYMKFTDQLKSDPN